MSVCPITGRKAGDAVCPITGRKASEAPATATTADACPIIHKVTATTAAEDRPLRQTDIDDIDENPNVKEYRKLKKTMSTITSFYQGGSKMKHENYLAMAQEIEKLEMDKAMVSAQLKALQEHPAFVTHPKAVTYKENLDEELAGLNKQAAGFQEKLEEFHGLYEWSKKIVEVCQWLEQNMNNYCAKNLDLPIKIETKELPELTDAQKEEFSRGLDEITYNLQESQDFFEASVDGRLQVYHQIEKDLITAQLKALESFPEDSPRRQYVESELNKDLEYVSGNMKDDPSVRRRRQKMLDNHRDFLAVLKYHKDKLGVLITPEATATRVYESKYTMEYKI